MTNVFTISNSPYKNNEFKWTHSSNWLLINSYLELKEEFCNPGIRKKELWTKIYNKFRDVGYEVPFELLDIEFRKLKSTYYQIKKRRQNSSNKIVKWEYYKVFDELLKDDGKGPIDRRSSAYVPGIRKRKRVRMTKKPNIIKENTNITIEPAVVGSLENDEDLSEKNEEIDIITTPSEEEGYDYEYEVINEDHSKRVDLRYLEAKKLHAETKYFHKKADYFDKQTQNLELQRKLMIMQAHKLKLEIDRLKNDKDT